MSKLADAAFSWMSQHAPDREISTDELWRGMKDAFPLLTATTNSRKTPRNTLMRDVRLDKQGRFIVKYRRIVLSKFGRSEIS
jgi:hypothetical protein